MTFSIDEVSRMLVKPATDLIVAEHKIERLERERDELREALKAIQHHWACQYDHTNKQSEMYSGPYGIGVTDGHRCCAEIARAALTKIGGQP